MKLLVGRARVIYGEEGETVCYLPQHVILSTMKQYLQEVAALLLPFLNCMKNPKFEEKIAVTGRISYHLEEQTEVKNSRKIDMVWKRSFNCHPSELHLCSIIQAVFALCGCLASGHFRSLDPSTVRA